MRVLLHQVLYYLLFAQAFCSRIINFIAFTTGIMALPMRQFQKYLVASKENCTPATARRNVCLNCKEASMAFAAHIFRIKEDTKLLAFYFLCSFSRAMIRRRRALSHPRRPVCGLLCLEFCVPIISSASSSLFPTLPFLESNVVWKQGAAAPQKNCEMEGVVCGDAVPPCLPACCAHFPASCP